MTMRLEVRAIGRKGRGVFAAAPIRGGELLETAYTVEIGPDEIAAGSVLDNYPFAHPGDPERGLLVLGLPSLMNHSDEANTETLTRHVDGLGWIVEIRAVRDIAPGEEVTRRYACDLWFEPEPPGRG